MKKTIVIIIIVALVSGIGYGVWMYQQAPADISKIEAQQTINASELIAEFEKDATASNQKYTGKVIAVKTKVASMENPISIISESGEKYIISFQFNDSLAQTYTKGAILTIKGQYNGYLEPDDMFGMPGNIQISQSTIEP